MMVSRSMKLGSDRLPPRPLQIADDLRESIERPVEVVSRDDKRRRQSNDRVVCFLRENAFRQQAFAGVACGCMARIDFGGCPQAAAPDCLQYGTLDGAQTIEHVSAKHTAAFDQPLVPNNMERLEAHGGGSYFGLGPSSATFAVVPPPELHEAVAVTVRQWAGVFGPPKMPRDIVERLNKEVNAALKRPDVLEQLQRYGYAAEGSTPEGLTAINREDLALWRKLVREAGIALE